MESLTERILFEDNHLIIVNKLPGEIVQGDKTGDKSLLDDVKEYIAQRSGKQGNVFAGLVHRIDRPVSGAIVFARTSKSLSRMTQMVKDRSFYKTYWAIVRQAPPQQEETLVHYLVKNEKQNKSYVCSDSAPGARQASLKYTLISSSKSFHLLEIELYTGRHHQIRAQLAAVGCPIAGDLKYGSERSNPDGSICLHARKVSFEHPVRREMLEIIAPVSNEMPWKLFVL